MVWSCKKRITEREALVIDNYVGWCYITSKAITSHLFSNHDNNDDDDDDDYTDDDDVLASDIVLTEDVVLEMDDLEENIPNKDMVFILQIIEEKSKVEWEIEISEDNGLDDVIFDGNGNGMVDKKKELTWFDILLLGGRQQICVPAMFWYSQKWNRNYWPFSHWLT